MNNIKVAIVGVGNVGATFAQGVDYYSSNKSTIGLWHPKIAGLKPINIKIVAAFDVDPVKVGRDLSQLVGESTRKQYKIRESKVIVHAGIQYDKNNKIEKPMTISVDEVIEELRKSGAQIALNLISSGSDKTSLEYAKAALHAHIAFVNATPAKLANNPELARKFVQNKLVLAGDDLLSQFGGTAFHKGMIDFMVERGVYVKKSYQLDVGGSAETENTMDERIRMMKRSMKTSSISMEAPYRFESVAGTTEYTDFLGDSRSSYYWMQSEGFLGSNIVMDLVLRTNDGSNAGNVLFDIVRAIGGARDAKVRKAAETISAYGFKNPPKQYRIREAYSNFIKMFS
jgi:myo-inositol-1-phosphate synthase